MLKPHSGDWPHRKECTNYACYCADPDLSDPVCDCGRPAWACNCDDHLTGDEAARTVKELCMSMSYAERERKFMANHIGERTREQLASELFGIYLALRAAMPSITDEFPDDPWPARLHLADVLCRDVLPAVTPACVHLATLSRDAAGLLESTNLTPHDIGPINITDGLSSEEHARRMRPTYPCPQCARAGGDVIECPH